MNQQSYHCQSPVLFLVFNRPDVTRRVFEAIRAARPPRLYVAADGARADREGEDCLVQEVRSIATNVDWDCEVKTLFRNKNLGCGLAVSGAITWFFENEPEGIILEDDCLPTLSFFDYSNWALNTYRKAKNVWHISGNNFRTPVRYFEGKPVSFAALPQVWGWATWRDRWERYIFDAQQLSRTSKEPFNAWALRPKSKQYKLKNIEDLNKGLDTWDYQWQIVVLNHLGLVVVPCVNLITNLGVGEDATHTRSINDWRLGLPVGEWAYEGPAVLPKINNRISRHFEGCMCIPSFGQRIYWKIKRVLGTLRA